MLVFPGLALSLVFAWATLTLGSPAAQDATPPPADSLDQLPPGATPMPLPTRMPRPMPAARIPGDRAELVRYFAALGQGQTGLLQVVGEGVTGARMRFENELIDFFPVEGDGLYGLLAVNIEQTTRRYPLDVFVTFADGTRSAINTEVEIVLGGFIRQDVAIPPEKGFLLDPETERNELARLESIMDDITLVQAWDETGFQMPIPSTLTSPFGAFRTFNQSLNTRHTGWDIKTTLGTPILASAAGEVAFAGEMDIRGSYVVVDHGYGVYSGYAHLSQTHVTRGQAITKGQVLGMVGDSGRTSGPHFHWEMAVNGQWVDSVQFIEMWMP
jgi:murein DD-endopeptidase MepM/ murein hydrolase activator NlpD